MLDEVRGYVQLASGLTEMTTARAKELAAALLGQGRTVVTPDVVGQVQGLADELVETSRNNRELLIGLIRAEVDRAVGRMGFVREDELAALRRHVQRLETQLAAMQSGESVPAKKATKKPTTKATKKTVKKVVKPKESS
jgi:polyhydroxyalkanoate synthesis regulator phasin